MKTKLALVTVCLLAVVTMGSTTRVMLGGGWQDGHSWSGKYSVDSGYSLMGEVERGDRWSYGLDYMYSNFGRTDNEPYVDKSRVNSHRILGYGKYNFDWVSEDIVPFVKVGAGYELADDRNKPIGLIGAGTTYWLSKSWALEGIYNYFLRPDRNYKSVIFGVKYRF